MGSSGGSDQPNDRSQPRCALAPPEAGGSPCSLFPNTFFLNAAPTSVPPIFCRPQKHLWCVENSVRSPLISLRSDPRAVAQYG